MEYNYLILLDYSIGEIIRIKLTEEQKRDSEKYDDFEEYLMTLEDGYGFRLLDCSWMAVERLQETAMDSDTVNKRNLIKQVSLIFLFSFYNQKFLRSYI